MHRLRKHRQNKPKPGMSEDAVPKSPFLLMAELDRYFETGVTNRIVNEKDLEA